MIEAIDHVEVVTRDMEKSLDFYVNKLGFEIHNRHRFEGGMSLKEITYVKIGDVMIELMEFPNAIMPSKEGPEVGVRMFALRVGNMDEEIERLTSLGVEISQPPRPIGPSKRAEIKDPNGISIELRQW